MPAAADLVLKGGLVVTPAGIIEGGVAVSGGVIVAVARDELLPAADQEIDLAGKYLLPGVIDPEAHLGSVRPLDADFASETRAAAAAGVTTWGLQLLSTFITGPGTEIHGPGDIPSFLPVMPSFLEAGQGSTIDYFLTPIISSDAQVDEIPTLAREHGVTSFKLHLQMRGGWRPNWPAYAFDDGLVYRVLRSVAELGYPGLTLLHCENWQIADVLQRKLMRDGRTDMGAWDDHSPWFTEAADARTYLYLARLASCPAYVVHATTEATLAEIESSRREGGLVFAEIGTHYLVLHKDAWRINVPLRDETTHDSLWHALQSGRINCLGSDHVAHELDREAMDTGNVWTTISGFPSRVEGMLPMALSEGVNKGRLTIERLAKVASENPARIFGLYPRKGIIAVGSDADLIVVDLQRTATVSTQILQTASHWTIYDGREVTGWPVMVFVRGRLVSEWPESEPRARVQGRPGGMYLGRSVIGGKWPADSYLRAS